MDSVSEERRFARWICRQCQAVRYAPIPRDGQLKCPICYSPEAFVARRHARRDLADRGKRPDEIAPHLD